MTQALLLNSGGNKVSLLDDIKAKTDFEVLGDGKVRTFTRRPIVRTPIKAIDTIIGGGIPLGCVVDLFGPPGSGKSSYGYECLGHFQQQYPDGLGVLIDSETSCDEKRMRALGVDPTRLLVLRGATMESGYKQILSILYTVSQEKPKNRVPIFILWDSLSNTTTEAQYNKENVNGGGLAEAARINKEYLKQISIYLDDVDAMIVFINQVSSKIGMFVGSGYNEAGGNALKHGVQYKLTFGKNTTNYEDGLAVSADGSVAIEKNKIGPVSKSYPIHIDCTKGGVISTVRSFMNFIYTYVMDEVKKRGLGARYYFRPSFFKRYPRFHQYIAMKYPEWLEKGVKWEDLLLEMEIDYAQGGIFLDFFIQYWGDYISDRYVLQKEVIQPYHDELDKKIEDYRKSQGWDEDYQLPDLPDNDSSDEDDE